MLKDFWQAINIFNKDFFLKPYTLHIAWVIVVSFVLIGGTLGILNYFTEHNVQVKVPNVVSLNSQDAIRQLKEANFTPVLHDSVFIDKFPPNTIIKQVPDSGTLVKAGRRVLLIINRRVPPFVDLPNLLGLNYEAAKDILKSKSLYIADTIYKNDIAENAVIEYAFRGRTMGVSTNEKVPIGSGIVVYFGNGIASQIEYEFVPNLIGLPLNHVQAALEKLHLRLVVKNGNDNPALDDNRIIEKQNPLDIKTNGEQNKILQGEPIEVWLR